ncbi:hypothetical protein T01_11874 [Trichinella spiralis]|uniref:Uncharacterized protein n=1 Tax=Trichinella spiralis TaxID=6334 RepID=A0A0V0ZDK5_TRISP|nr:hypothetical protein T01_11874 [Trichinella spiralis]
MAVKRLIPFPVEKHRSDIESAIQNSGAGNVVQYTA